MISLNENKIGILKNNLSLYLLIVIVFTLPFSISVNSIAILLFVLNCLWQGKLKEKIERLKAKKLFYLFILFYILHLIGFLYSDNKASALFDLERKLSLLVFPLFLGSLSLNQREVTIILHTQVLSTLVASLICLLSNLDLYANFDNDINNSAFRNELTSPIGIHHVYLSIYIIFSLFIILHFLITLDRKRLNIPLFISGLVSFAILLFILIQLSSRTPLIAFCIAFFLIIIVYILIEKKYKYGLIGGFLMLIIALILANSPSIKFVYNLSLRTDYDFKSMYWYDWNGGLNLRLAIWKCTADAIKENNIWIGTGIGDIQDDMQRSYKKFEFQFAAESNFSPHSQYLETLLGLGIIGLLLLLMLFFIPAFIAISRRSYLYLLFLLVFFLCCSTESMFNTQKGIVFYAFFNSLFYFHFFPKYDQKR